MENNEELYPELKDIVEMIKNYNTAHPEGCFVLNFIGFKKDVNTVCEECNGHCDEVDENKSLISAYGDLQTLRDLVNMLRDFIEDEAEDGWVNI